MSKNLYKAAWVVVSGDEKHVIDSNSLMEKRMEELEVLEEQAASSRKRDMKAGTRKDSWAAWARKQWMHC